MIMTHEEHDHNQNETHHKPYTRHLTQPILYNTTATFIHETGTAA